MVNWSSWGVDPELHKGTATSKQLRWHDLRATGATWLAVRGDEPLKIKQRCGHQTFGTTELYIREAEAVRDGFGEVFPPLPPTLLGSAESSGESSEGSPDPSEERLRGPATPRGLRAGRCRSPCGLPRRETVPFSGGPYPLGRNRPDVGVSRGTLAPMFPLRRIVKRKPERHGWTLTLDCGHQVSVEQKEELRRERRRCTFNARR